MSTLKTFLSKTERLVFHMIDGSIVDIHMDFVKDIQEADGYYSIYMDTGKMIVVWDKTISWMEVELKNEPEKARNN